MEIIYKIDDFPNPGDRDVYRGIQEINKGNYQEAQKCFEKGSNYDNEYASLFNALHYYTGFGFAKRDPSKALNLFKKIALEWNNPVAQYLIGTMYLKGDKGVPQNGKYAMKWLLLAAENNWADAMVLTGLGYLLGGLFKEDVLKSVSWFQKVVQKDDSETEPIDDGTLYLFGNKEFELHLNQVDNTFIKTTIDEEILPPVHYIDPSDSSITADWGQRLYIIFWSILTNKKSRGIVPSQLLIGEMCSQTDGQKSTYFFKKAAKNGSGKACMLLGLAYEYGKNGVEDSIEALKWYKRTLELHGNIEAAYRIGVIFYNGKGIETDCKVALRYFKLRVRDSDHGPSYIFMGDIYEKGKDGVPNNYVLARQHFEKAFSCGEVRGAVALTRFYIEGLGVRKDMKKSEEWMMKAMTAKSTLEQTPPGILRFMRMFDN